MFKLCSFTFPSSSKAQANPSVRNYDSTLHFFFLVTRHLSWGWEGFLLLLQEVTKSTCILVQFYSFTSRPPGGQTFTFSQPSPLEASEYREWSGRLKVPQVLTQVIGTLAYRIWDSTKLWPSRHLHSARSSTVHISFFCFTNVWKRIM